MQHCYQNKNDASARLSAATKRRPSKQAKPKDCLSWLRIGGKCSIGQIPQNVIVNAKNEIYLSKQVQKLKFYFFYIMAWRKSTIWTTPLKSALKSTSIAKVSRKVLKKCQLTSLIPQCTVTENSNLLLVKFLKASFFQNLCYFSKWIVLKTLLNFK